QVSEYFKHLDCVNVAQLIGGDICGVSIYCNWNDPAKLVASATATECSGIVYANVVAPLVSLIALGRAYFLMGESEQDDLKDLIAPALKGLSRSGAEGARPAGMSAADFAAFVRADVSRWAPIVTAVWRKAGLRREGAASLGGPPLPSGI